MISGIYSITNKINNKKYIGQSKNIHKRFIDHTGQYKDCHLYRAMKKYGIDSFEFVIEKIISPSPIINILLDVYESYFINKYKTYISQFGYNKQLGGYGGTPTDEVKRKQSESAIRYWSTMSKEERKLRAMNNPGKTGFVEPYETRIKKSKSHIGLKHTQEAKDKISMSKTGKKRDPEIFKRVWETRRKNKGE